MTYFSYFLFIAYCFIRVMFLFRYRGVLKDTSSIEERLKILKKENSQKELCKGIYNEHSKNIVKMQKIYKKDHNLKYFGALTIGIFAFISVICKFSQDLNVMLPALLTLFNTFFEKFEVELPWEYTKPTAEFI